MKVSWVTPAGSLGTFVENNAITITLVAIEETIGDVLTYSLLNGVLPAGISLSATGILSGILNPVSVDSKNEFTVRVTETGVTPGVIDRTFSMTVTGPSSPIFAPIQPNLPTSAIQDCTWFECAILVINPDPGTTTQVTVVSGSLPAGLEIGLDGVIKGYPQPPVTATLIPTSTTSTFTLRVSTESGYTDQIFSITVANQQLSPSFVARKPTILNSRPLSLMRSISDNFYSYYTDDVGSLGRFAQSDIFITKIIGYNWDAISDPYVDDLTYIVSGITAGSNLTDAFDSLVTDGNGFTGWINGVLKNIGADVTTFSFDVAVAITSNLTIISDTFTFKFTLVGAIDDSVVWITNSDLGTISNGTISNFAVSADFGAGVTDGSYRLVSGSLVPGLEVLSNGNIAGRVDFKTLFQTYTFSVEAYSPTYSSVSAIREFTVTVVETYNAPFDTVYMRALLSNTDRQRINKMLAYIQMSHSADIYRSSDSHYGIAKNIRYDHMYGVPSVSSQNPLNPSDLNFFYNVYIAAIQKNFYGRQLTLGELKTARASDNNNNTIYEVVYCQIIDDLINDAGISISKEVAWPHPIITNTNPLISADQLVYPNSLPNMRQQLAEMLGDVNSDAVLPRWMTSQQSDGSVTGFVPAWVICSTLPGKSGNVLKTLTNYLATNTEVRPLRTLNQISFELDRIEVDRSLSYTWGSTTPEQWPPSPTSASVDNDSQDSTIYFPRKNILVIR